MNQTPRWATSIAAQVRPLLTEGRASLPERGLAAAVIRQAYEDAFGGSWTANSAERADAIAFFRDWRLDAYCSAIGLDAGLVRRHFEAKLRGLLNGTIRVLRGRSTIIMELAAQAVTGEVHG